MLCEIKYILLRWSDTLKHLDQRMMLKVFNRLIVAEHIETFHRTCEYTFSHHVYLAKAEKVLFRKFFMDCTIKSNQLIEVFLI